MAFTGKCLSCGHEDNYNIKEKNGQRTAWCNECGTFIGNEPKGFVQSLWVQDNSLFVLKYRYIENGKKIELFDNEERPISKEVARMFLEALKGYVDA